MVPLTDETFVVIGAGLAGGSAVAALRDEGFTGRLVLFGAEAHPPYHRPPLSKTFLRGEREFEQSFVNPPEFYGANEVELHLSTTVDSIDAERSEVVVSNGDRINYDKLLLATGSEPKRLPIPGNSLAGVMYLRTVEDSLAIRAHLHEGKELVVVGAGWIGCEVAASARQLGVNVTIVEPLATPLERVVGQEVGGVICDLHHSHGVETRFGTGVEAFEGNGHVERVRLSDGRTVECDLVVVGIGVAPRVEVASSVFPDTQNGIPSNEFLQTKVQNIFVAGDIARAYHPILGRDIRVEHWSTARNQGPIAAKNMLGKSVAYEEIPSFFSDQYDVQIRYLGDRHGSENVLFRGRPTDSSFIAFWLDNGVISAGMSLNAPGAQDDIKALISNRVRVLPDELMDPSTPLQQFVSSG